MAKNPRYSASPSSAPSSPRTSPPIPGRQPTEPLGNADLSSGITGRKIVVFREGRSKSALSQIQSVSGLSSVVTASSVDFEPVAAKDADILHFPKLGVAVLNANSADQLSRVSSLAGQTDSDIMYIFDEGYFILSDPTPASSPEAGRSYSADYLNGMIDALTLLRDGCGAQVEGTAAQPPTPGEARTADVSGPFQNTDDATWGINAVGALNSQYSGKGIKVAILDSGFDLTHPDFVNRNITVQPFTGLDGSDFNGHGTHCVGIACGGKGGRGVRYGVAYEADIYVGQVFGNGPMGATATDTDILNGIQWAIDKGCHIVSMSLERDPQHNPVRAGESYKDTQAGLAYEEIAARAIRGGTLLIAAAGNGSSRPSNVLPVNQPANCPSIIAVGALKSNLQVAGFSNQGINLDGGRVDFAGPGEGIISSWPMPIRYNTDSGTSMATPFVAGLAALIAEQTGVRGYDLWWKLSEAAKAFGLDAADVGFGMPVAPQ